MTSVKEEIKKPIKENNTPLVIIREKELELKKYLIETQIQADKVVEDALKEAASLKEKIALDGEKKAQEFYQTELIKIKQEAQEVESQAPQVARNAREVGLKNLDKTIGQFKDVLIPKLS